MSRDERIRTLNDAFRAEPLDQDWYLSYQMMLKRMDFSSQARTAIQAVRFADGDPSLRDSGTVVIQGEKVDWRIEYATMDRRAYAEDPTDWRKTRRCMSLKLADEKWDDWPEELTTQDR